MPARESNGRSSLELLVADALERIARRLVDLFKRLRREIADGQPADPARGRHVALEQRRRGREHGRDVVESVARIVDRQPLARLDVDGQQIADRVAVLGAIQPVNRRPARIGVCRSRAVERRLEESGERGQLFRSSGRSRTLGGGISPERTFRRTFSHAPASALTLVTSTCCRERPPVFSLSL